MRGMVSGAAWADCHAWMIRLDRTGRQTSAQLDDKGDAIVYRRSMPYRDKHHVFRERLPHGSEETPTTASTAQAVLRIAYASASDLCCLGVHRVRHHRQTARKSRHQEAPIPGARAH